MGGSYLPVPGAAAGDQPVAPDTTGGNYLPVPGAAAEGQPAEPGAAEGDHTAVPGIAAEHATAPGTPHDSDAGMAGGGTPPGGVSVPGAGRRRRPVGEGPVARGDEETGGGESAAGQQPSGRRRRRAPAEQESGEVVRTAVASDAAAPGVPRQAQVPPAEAGAPQATQSGRRTRRPLTTEADRTPAQGTERDAAASGAQPPGPTAPAAAYDNAPAQAATADADAMRADALAAGGRRADGGRADAMSADAVAPDAMGADGSRADAMSADTAADADTPEAHTTADPTGRFPAPLTPEPSGTTKFARARPAPAPPAAAGHVQPGAISVRTLGQGVAFTQPLAEHDAEAQEGFADDPRAAEQHAANRNAGQATSHTTGQTAGHPANQAPGQTAGHPANQAPGQAPGQPSTQAPDQGSGRRRRLGTPPDGTPTDARPHPGSAPAAGEGAQAAQGTPQEPSRPAHPHAATDHATGRPQAAASRTAQPQAPTDPRTGHTPTPADPRSRHPHAPADPRSRQSQAPTDPRLTETAGRAYAVGAPDAAAIGRPEPLDGQHGVVEVDDDPDTALLRPIDDEIPPEPLDNPRRLLVWPEPDGATSQALTNRGYRPVVVRSREEVDTQIAAYPAALFVDPLTGPITRTALQALRTAAVAAEVPVLVTAGLGQATREAAYGADPAVLLKALAPRDSEMHPSRVLLFEEDPDIAAALTTALERRGMQVGHAADDQTAISLATQMRPNLVVMDLMQVRRRRAGIIDWLSANGLLARMPMVVYTRADIDGNELPRLRSGETVLFLAERSTSAEVQSRIVDLLSKIGTN